jgi:hypothetical protein
MEVTVKTRPAIPAEIRRQILVEAGHRCAIQTCRNSANVDIHHIIPWEIRQDHSPVNLIALCPNCHRLAHDGTIDRKALMKYKEICQKLVEPPVRHEDTTVRAYIKFDPNTVTGIFDAKNLSSFTDHGILNFSFRFLEPFEDETYVVNAIGDGSVEYHVVEKTREVIQILFGSPCPNIVRLEFRY